VAYNARVPGKRRNRLLTGSSSHDHRKILEWLPDNVHIMFASESFSEYFPTFWQIVSCILYSTAKISSLGRGDHRGVGGFDSGREVDIPTTLGVPPAAATGAEDGVPPARGVSRREIALPDCPPLWLLPTIECLVSPPASVFCCCASAWASSEEVGRD